MIQIDTSDFLYKTLQKLGVEDEIENQYLTFAKEGISNIKDFNNYLQASLGLDYVGDFDENIFEQVVDYYQDLKTSKIPNKSKTTTLLKQYKEQPSEELRNNIINSQLKEVLFIACTYKLSHIDYDLSDLVQVANLGLIKAIDKYDVNSKLTFETYLNYWVWDSIKKEFTQGEKNG